MESRPLGRSLKYKQPWPPGQARGWRAAVLAGTSAPPPLWSTSPHPTFTPQRSACAPEISSSALDKPFHPAFGFFVRIIEVIDDLDTLGLS